MMAEKHLGELLREDQEPFHLKSYMSSRRKTCLLRSPKKRRPISQNSNFGHNFCRNPCFFASSPDPSKSPLFDPQTRAPADKNAVFLHVPAKTAALLLEAALRIHNHSENERKSEGKNNPSPAKPTGVGIFSSLLRKLSKQRKIRGQAGEKAGDHGSRLSVKDILRPRRSFRTSKEVDAEFMGSFLAGKEIALVAKSRVDAESSQLDDNLSSSRSDSPRSSTLRNSPPSSGRRTPESRSPAVSPRPHDPKDMDDHEAMSLKKFEGRESAKEEEEEKEQCSPVSVLDHPFEDEDDDEHTNEDYDGDDDYPFDYESSYALVQRTKQQLLQKLYRFERLAELDPVELEKRMLEQISDEEDGLEEVMSDHDDDLVPMNIEKAGDGFAKRSLIRPTLCAFNNARVPSEMRRLIIDEEQGKQVYVVGSWKGVDFSTIDLMVDQDFIRDEVDGLWKRSHNKDQAGDTAVEIELAIFGSLVQELSEELSRGLGNEC